MADSAGRSDRGRGRLPTIVDVASRAGVSIATVSRVVSGTGRVREPTRARVEQAIAATGWTADPAARVLAGGTGDEVILAIAVTGQQPAASRWSPWACPRRRCPAWIRTTRPARRRRSGICSRTPASGSR